MHYQALAIHPDWLAKYDAHAAAPASDATTHRGVAVVPVTGAIYRGAAERVVAQVRAAVADPRIAAVVLGLDTPGGTTTGLPEAHAALMALRGTKPIVAQVSHMAASAGYWLASAADEIVASPSSVVGSIGVYMMHVDQSAALAQEGLKATYISAGRDKVLGNGTEPLTDEGRAYYQGMVDEAYAQFTGDVARGRGVGLETVQGDAYGSGRVVTPRVALAQGMIDSIATLGDTLARFMPASATQRRARQLALLTITGT
jgi:signal peptide peptidase SppA